MRYRVEQLATACEVSVDTVRYYQSRNLLPQPEREGRVAWYDEIHAERIRRIRDLQRKGLTLEAVGRVVRGELADADADLAAAVAEARGEVGEDRRSLDLEDFAATSGVPASLIQAVEREGIRIGRPVDGQMRYTPADTELVRTALRLLEFGLPLGDLLGLARDADGGPPRRAGRAGGQVGHPEGQPAQGPPGGRPRARPRGRAPAPGGPPRRPVRPARAKADPGHLGRRPRRRGADGRGVP